MNSFGELSNIRYTYTGLGYVSGFLVHGKRFVNLLTVADIKLSKHCEPERIRQYNVKITLSTGDKVNLVVDSNLKEAIIEDLAALILLAKGGTPKHIEWHSDTILVDSLVEKEKEDDIFLKFSILCILPIILVLCVFPFAAL